jgi:hypothetical protein
MAGSQHKINLVQYITEGILLSTSRQKTGGCQYEKHEGDRRLIQNLHNVLTKTANYTHNMHSKLILYWLKCTK